MNKLRNTGPAAAPAEPAAAQDGEETLCERHSLKNWWVLLSILLCELACLLVGVFPKK